MTSAVRDACRRQGISYRLHGGEVMDEYGTHDERRAIERLWALLPRRQAAVIVSDWARWRIMEQGGAGTLYLDADVVLGAGRIPADELHALPHGLHCIPEGYNGSLPNTAVLYANGTGGGMICRMAGKLAAGRMAAQADLGEQELRTQWQLYTTAANLVNFLGPGWMRRYVIPQAEERGWYVHRMPATLANNHGEPLLRHMAHGAWLRK